MEIKDVMPYECLYIWFKIDLIVWKLSELNIQIEGGIV